jgi:hypothetical protein
MYYTLLAGKVIYVVQVYDIYIYTGRKRETVLLASEDGARSVGRIHGRRAGGFVRRQRSHHRTLHGSSYQITCWHSELSDDEGRTARGQGIGWISSVLYRAENGDMARRGVARSRRGEGKKPPGGRFRQCTICLTRHCSSSTGPSSSSSPSLHCSSSTGPSLQSKRPLPLLTVSAPPTSLVTSALTAATINAIVSVLTNASAVLLGLACMCGHATLANWPPHPKQLSSFLQ